MNSLKNRKSKDKSMHDSVFNEHNNHVSCEENSQTENKKVKSSKGMLFVSIIAFISMVIFLSYQVMAYYKPVQEGTKVGSLDVGGVKQGELKKVIKDYGDKKLEQEKVTFSLDNEKKEVPLKEVGVEVDEKITAEKVIEVNNIKKVANELQNGQSVDISYKVDVDKLIKMIEDMDKKNKKNPKEIKVEVNVPQKLAIVDSGHDGEKINAEKAIQQVKEIAKTGKSEPIKLEKVPIKKKQISVDEIYKVIYKKPIDAKFKVVNNQVQFEEGIDGLDIDKNIINASLVEINTKNDIKKEFKIEAVKPKKNVEYLQSRLFKDTLGSFTTEFKDTQSNKWINVRIASSKIFNTVFAPGSVFSYNKVVGPRTEELGYKLSGTIMNGEITDTIGGGVCHVATTLYNAVLLSDLEVVQRRNHTFIIRYSGIGQDATMGRDATVSYGAVDFQFKNNTEWPIKIEGYYNDATGQLHYSIKGTNEKPGKSVRYEHKVVETFKDDKIKYTYSDKYKTGQYIAAEEGYLVELYKITMQNGQEVERKKVSTSKYSPRQKQVFITNGDPMPTQ